MLEEDDRKLKKPVHDRGLKQEIFSCAHPGYSQHFYNIEYTGRDDAQEHKECQMNHKI